jgi:trk system potassium uptake protein
LCIRGGAGHSIPLFYWEQEDEVHVVVIGCGRVGSELAGALEQSGHSVAVVDKNARAFRRLPKNFGGTTVVGFGFDRDHLEAAGISKAEAFASVTSGDNSNILCARIARETYGIEHVVARIYDPRRALIYQRLGIPTVATVAWTTDQVLRRLLPAETRNDWVDPTGQIGLVEREIPAKAVGKKLALLNQPGRFWLTAVTRFGKAQIVTADMVGQEGDVLVFVSEVAATDDLQAHIEAGGEH